LLIEDVEHWSIFTTQRRDPHRETIDYDTSEEVPVLERFALEVMAMAGADDNIFDLYMDDLRLSEVFRRNALKVAATWRPASPPE
jgi:hypothetical protein